MSTDDDDDIGQIGTMVVDPRGRVEIVVNNYVKTCRVQFAHSGSHATSYKKNLRAATQEEIDDAGWSGYKALTE